MKFIQNCIKENWNYKEIIYIQVYGHKLRAEPYTRLDPNQLPDFFPYWLGGLIEASGFFTRSKEGAGVFLIYKKNEPLPRTLRSDSEWWQHNEYLFEAICTFYKAPPLSVFIKDGRCVFRLITRADIQRVINPIYIVLQGSKFSQLVSFVESDRMHNAPRISQYLTRYCRRSGGVPVRDNDQKKVQGESNLLSRSPCEHVMVCYGFEIKFS